MTNLVVLHGSLSRPAAQVELPSGTRLTVMEVTVRTAGAPTDTVPVTWPDAPAWASCLDSGTEIVVLGRVRRRFFRAGGSTQSRTEVVAAKAVKASRRGRLSALLREAQGVLDHSFGPGLEPGGRQRVEHR